MSDPYIVRDENGNPLTSIFHKPPTHVLEFEFKSRRKGIVWTDKLKEEFIKMCNNLWEPIEDYHPDEVEDK